MEILEFTHLIEFWSHAHVNGHTFACHLWWVLRLMAANITEFTETAFKCWGCELLNSQVPYQYTHSVPKRMVTILKALFWDVLCVSKMAASLFKFQWPKFLRVQITIHQHFIGQWRRFEQATSHYLNWYALKERLQGALVFCTKQKCISKKAQWKHYIMLLYIHISPIVLQSGATLSTQSSSLWLCYKNVQ